MNDKNSSDKSIAEKLGLLKISIITILIASVLAAVVQFFIVPHVNEDNANANLKKVVEKSGTMKAINNILIDYKGTVISGTNNKQKALAPNSVKGSGTSFMFSNGKNVGQKTVDAYVDLTNKQSRDFLLINEGNLKNLIESGQINLNIHPVPSSNKNSLIYGEAISESINTSPNKAWSFLYSLLKDDIISQDKETVDNKISDIVNLAKKNGVSDIDAESIANGTFSSWLVDGGKDRHLDTGYYPPIIYVNNNLIDKNTNVNDPNIFRKVVVQ